MFNIKRQPLSAHRNKVLKSLIIMLGLSSFHLVIADEKVNQAKIPASPKYQQECAACHIAYPAGMLPAASWKRLMNNLPKLGFDYHETMADEIKANEVLLSVLLRNLIDNAIRYSPSLAVINIRLSGDNDNLLVVIEDSGKGMDQSAIQRLGERFFRVTEQEESGSGLGWSIVHRIAQVHQLSIRIRPSKDLGGLAVTIHFPHQVNQTSESLS
jgi:signal transduction histidine kinase